MSKISYLVSAFALTGFVGLVVGCGGPSAEDSLSTERQAALVACHLNDGTVERNADIRACDPQDKKKTTICHIPPGNPANAHTLCIGNAGVPAHLRNHGDYLGVCKNEAPCPPPVTGAGGSSDDTGVGGMSGTGDSVTGSAGTGAAGTVAPSTGTSGSSGGSYIVP
jgi:hypothetical protein